MIRSILYLLLGVCSTLLVAALPALAQDNEIPLYLTSRDEYVIRSMKVTKKSGEMIPALLTIDAYDPVAKTFIFEDVDGVKKPVKASDLKYIEFIQDIVEQSPFVQEAAYRINAVKGEENKIAVSAKELKIRSGVFYVKKKTLGTLAEQKGVIEVLKISPISPRNRFTVVIQNVQYTKKYFGGGGPSGIRKGLQ